MDGPLLRQPAVWSLRLRFQAASCSPVGRVSCLESHLAPGPFCLWGQLCFLSLRWAHSLSSDAAQPPHVPHLLFTPWRFRGRILTSHPAAFSHYCQSWSSAAHLFVCLVIPACVCVLSRFSCSFSYFRRRMKPHLFRPFISESFLNPPGTG